MSLLIFADTHISKTIVQQLGQNDVDIVRLEETEDLPNNATDEQILSYAVSQGRMVLSLDSDFAHLHTLWLQKGKTHCGIFLGKAHLQGSQGIGVIVRTITEYQRLVVEGAGGASDLYDTLIWI